MAPSGKKGVVISAVGNLIPPAVGLATAPILAVTLGPTARGELAAVTTALVLAVTIGTFGVPQALVYFSARKGRNHSQLVLKSTAGLGLFGLAASACVWLLADTLSSGNDHVARLISYAGLAISPALILASLRGVASGVQAWALVAGERIISSGIRLVAIIVAFQMGALNIENATIIIATTTFVGILAYLPLPRLVRYHTATICLEPTWREVVPLSATFWVGVATGALLARIDQLLLLPLAGAEQLGIYAVAVSISEMALLFNYAVNAVINAREAQKPDSESLAMAARISSLITCGGCVALGTVCIWVVPRLFGEDFTEVVKVVWILLAGIALSNAGTVIGSGLNGRGRPGLRSMSMSVALLLNIGLLAVLSPHWGAPGAAMSTAIASIIFATLNMLLFRTVYKSKISSFIGIRKSDLLFLLSAVTPHKAKSPQVSIGKP
jgi:O-antigen/teichoic acid export membrane protein